MNYTELIDLALTNISRAEDFDIEYSAAYANIAVAHALIAIAGELHRMNERQADEIEDRLDLSEARIGRLADVVANSAFKK